MKDKQKKLRLIIAAIVIIIIIVILTVLSLLKNGGVHAVSYAKSTTQVRIDAIKDDGTQESFQLLIKDDGTNAISETNPLNKNIYIVDGNLIYESAGKFKTVSPPSTYRDLYNTINKIKLSTLSSENGAEKNYNPLVSKEIINEILENLQIEKRTNRSEASFIVTEKNYIKSFSIYLIDIEGYNGVNINVSFKSEEDSFRIELPVFYDKLTEESNGEEMNLLK